MAVMASQPKNLSPCEVCASIIKLHGVFSGRRLQYLFLRCTSCDWATNLFSPDDYTRARVLEDYTNKEQPHDH